MKRLHPVEEKFLNLNKECNLIEKGDVIVVGVSGGPDSITLLTCLEKYKKLLGCKIIVAHVNHLIREDSTDDELYVENICKKLNIPFYVKRAEVEKEAKKNKRGTEDMGRIIRYEFFDEVLEKEHANKIAIAHNMNDNAETVILNLLRGTGLSGLEGIKPFEYNKYIKPLINCTREEIEDYCEKENLNPRIDSTNKENIYRRNIIRNKILPELKEINPNIVMTLSNTSKVISDANEYIEKNVSDTYFKLKHMEHDDKEKEKENLIYFSLKEFNEEENVIKQGLVFKVIEEITGSTKNIEKKNVDDIILLAKRNIGNKHMELNKKIKIFVKNGKIFFEG